ncbi:MAG: glucokinase [Planctomycetaceae bacterium]|nr:glucokinase [Planctomycetaceae bacterium]
MSKNKIAGQSSESPSRAESRPVRPETRVRKLFVCDQGGTNGRFAWYDYVEATGSLVLRDSLQREVTDAGISIFTKLLHQAEKKFGIPLQEYDAAALAFACPVNREILTFANSELRIDTTALKEKFGKTPFGIINDFFAQGNGVASPQKKDWLPIIQEATPDPDVPRDVKIAAGAGSGFGTACIVDGSHEFDNVTIAGMKKVRIISGEGGHVSFPCNNANELELMNKVREIMGLTLNATVRLENVLSGGGIERTCRYFNGWSHKTAKSREVTKTFDLEYLEKDEASRQTFYLIATIYARAMRNYALSTLSYGGVYISGGVAVDHPKLIDNDIFRYEFRNTGEKNTAEALDKMPVWLAAHRDTGLYGAACYAVSLLPAL